MTTATAFTAPDYDLQAMSNFEIECAIKICLGHKLYGARNLNALFEEAYVRAGEQNPAWNTAGRYA